MGLALRDLRECCVLAQLKTAETRCFLRIISGNGADWQTRDCGIYFSSEFVNPTGAATEGGRWLCIVKRVQIGIRRARRSEYSDKGGVYAAGISDSVCDAVRLRWSGRS
ncbi:MAG TPA: hypothetical protein DCR20_08970 [Planctomycetaceae bacterium]|nr:hypothetical protein [Planctomycetaceae bacterium]